MVPEADRQVPPPPWAASDNADPSPDTAGIVERIFASTESAVAAIVRRTEHEVRGMAADLDAQLTRESMERRAQLARLRWELTEQAAALAAHYETILGELDAVEKALGAGLGGCAAGPSDAQVAAIKMTLRERQRISLAYDAPRQAAPPAPPSPEAAPAIGRRRWWRVWARDEAA